MIIPFGTMISKLLRALILTILPIPAGVYAADFLPLVGIPGVTNAGNAGFGDYINALYRLSISLAALLAVIKIVAAGAKYMLSDIVTNKESAKADIRGALLGLLIILGAFIILNTINTDITKNEFVIEDLKGADSSESRILRASAVSKANAVCARAESGGNSCLMIRCERGSVGGINNFEINPGETEEQACQRTCTDTYKGAYLYKPVSSSICTFVNTEANTCDINSNWNCCEERNNGSWDADSRTCTLEAGDTVDSPSQSDCESRPKYRWVEVVDDMGATISTSCVYTP
jgi:hypothetical protein